MIEGDKRDGFGPGEGGSLTFREVGGFAPCDKGIETLLRFATRPRGLRVQVDSVGAPIELRGTNFDEFDQ